MSRSDIENKIYTDPNLLANELNKKRTPRKKISLTNGCFDLLHRGHIEYLRQASKNSRIFVVILNSDASVTKLKGQYRPIQNQRNRAFILACFSFIDYILISGPEERLNVELEALPIDIYIKGGDYSIEQLDPGERAILQVKNCVFKFIPFVTGYSTTELIRKIIMAD